MPKISKKERGRKVVELYKQGASYSDIQKKYKISSKTIAKLVKGLEVKCVGCGKPKGKARFHAHPPDKTNRPNYTIPLCPQCHGKITAEEHKPVTYMPKTHYSSPFRTKPFGRAYRTPKSSWILPYGTELFSRMGIKETVNFPLSQPKPVETTNTDFSNIQIDNPLKLLVFLYLMSTFSKHPLNVSPQQKGPLTPALTPALKRALERYETLKL